jgi:Na+-transporting NADH:ubiquinone oxidoreductase subunit NqrC
MLIKFLVSITIAAIITSVFQYLLFKGRKRKIQEINKSILQAAILYFIGKNLNSNESYLFRHFVMKRLTDLNLMQNLSQLKIDIDGKDIYVAYRFFINSNTFDAVNFKISKTCNAKPFLKSTF